MWHPTDACVSWRGSTWALLHGLLLQEATEKIREAGWQPSSCWQELWKREKERWSWKNSWIHMPEGSVSGSIQALWMTCPISLSCPWQIPVTWAHNITSLWSLTYTLSPPTWLALLAAPHVRPCSQIHCLPAQPPLLSPFHLNYPFKPPSISILTPHYLSQVDGCLSYLLVPPSALFSWS